MFNWKQFCWFNMKGSNGAHMEKRSWLRAFVYRHCIRPHALSADEKGPRPPVTAILILSRHPNPTFSYYLEERIAALANMPVIVRDIGDRLDDIETAGFFVIICRYIRPWQLRWLQARRDQLSGVAYFVDDDVAAVIAGPEARWYYKWKLFQMALRPLLRLNPLLTDVWASTEALAAALARGSADVTVLPPYPPKVEAQSPMAADHPGSLTMIYHATAIHRQEHAFLIPIIEAAMQRHQNLRFDVIADGAVAAWWRRAAIDKKRLSVRPPLSWSAYVKSSQEQPADIALVPLLDGQVNNARSDTKRIDVVRSGAAAIFSHCAVYQRCAMPGESHVANTMEAWSAAIDLLVKSEEIRTAARNATVNSLDLMRSVTSSTFPDLSFEASAVRRSS